MERPALASCVVMAPQRDSTPVPAIHRFATACTRCPCIARALPSGLHHRDARPTHAFLIIRTQRRNAGGVLSLIDARMPRTSPWQISCANC